MLINIQRIVLTLWIGGLWVIGFLVAPALFRNLPDAQLAGTMAGVLFRYMNWLGLASAILLVVIYYFLDRAKWRFLVLFFMVMLIDVNMFYLTPEIAELRAMAGGAIIKGTELHNRFALLHGIASGTYLLVSLLGLLLVIRQPK